MLECKGHFNPQQAKQVQSKQWKNKQPREHMVVEQWELEQEGHHEQFSETRIFWFFVAI